jgi:hypothetical protein
MLIVILLAILLPRIPSKTGINPVFIPYLEKIKIISKGNLEYRGVHINFSKLSKYNIGICYYKRNEILIDKKYFKKADENSRILLLAHELAHCKKKIGHIDGVNKWGCGKHFMNSYDGGIWCNDYMFDKYVKQMETI